LRVGIYVRVSTDEQAKHGYSAPEQEEAGRKWAEKIAQPGEALEIAIFRDLGYSGAFLDRPGLSEMREQVRLGNLDVVIVRDPDRLSRKLIHQLILKEEIEKHARLEFVDQEWKNTSEGRLFFTIQGAFSEYEREKIKERMSRGKIKKAKMGGLPICFDTYGYKQENGKLIEDPVEAEIVRLIFKWFTTEDIGFAGIAARLVEMGVPAPRGGYYWEREAVRRIIYNTAYVGKLVYNRTRWEKQGHKAKKTADKKTDEWITIPTAPLVDKSTWDRAREKCAEMRRRYSGWSEGQYLLSGIVICSECGLPMHGITHKRRSGKVDRYYTCARSHTTDPAKLGCRPRRMVRLEELEACVWDLVAGWLSDPDELARKLQEQTQEGNLQEDMARIERRLQEIKKGRSNIRRALASGLMDLDEETAKTLADLKNQERQLEARFREIEAAARKKVAEEAKVKDAYLKARELLGKMGSLTFEQKKALVRTLVRRIMVEGRVRNFRVVVFAAFAPLAESARVGRSNA
jgi:site-specific DNA recombinase